MNRLSQTRQIIKMIILIIITFTIAVILIGWRQAPAGNTATSYTPTLAPTEGCGNDTYICTSTPRSATATITITVLSDTTATAANTTTATPNPYPVLSETTTAPYPIYVTREDSRDYNGDELTEILRRAFGKIERMIKQLKGGR